METVGQLKDQLAHCGLELGKAVRQLMDVEERLYSAGGTGMNEVRLMRKRLEETIIQIQPAVEELAQLDDQSPLSEHQDKLARMVHIFQALDGLGEKV